MENTATARNTEIDPVCGMKVVPGKTRLVSVYHGRSFWFCAPGCRRDFEEDPEKYLASGPPKPKGWLRRHLNRMAGANQKYLGAGSGKRH